MAKLKNKTLLITGASRGIGQAIALRFAREGANIAILTKDLQENIQSTTDQIVEAGGKVLILEVDVSDQEALQKGVLTAYERFKRIDILVNNTSATGFKNILETEPDQFDLMISTSVRAAFFLSKACYPYLKQIENPHIIHISPPLNLNPKWFKDHLVFSISKYAMSLCTLGMAEEFKSSGICVNSLWPQSTIATQTIKDHFSHKVFAGSRWPSIMGEAAFLLISQRCTGQFFTDEELLRNTGITDFSPYAIDLKAPLMQALFVEDLSHVSPISKDLFLINNGS